MLSCPLANCTLTPFTAAGGGFTGAFTVTAPGSRLTERERAVVETQPMVSSAWPRFAAWLPSVITRPVESGATWYHWGELRSTTTRVTSGEVENRLVRTPRISPFDTRKP